nr:PREDICTED: acid ceramidase-like isoform X1 [Bemisia tabaci]
MIQSISIQSHLISPRSHLTTRSKVKKRSLMIPMKNFAFDNEVLILPTMAVQNLYLIILVCSCTSVIFQGECKKFQKYNDDQTLLSNSLTSNVILPPHLSGRDLLPEESKFPQFHQECSNEPVPPIHGPLSIPSFKVDLDLPPKQRWKEVVTAKKTEMELFLQFIRNNTDRIFGKKVFRVVEKYLPKLLPSLPPIYQKEMRGIAETAEMEVGDVVLFNIFYEFFSLCTSVVMEGKDGTMYHGRNLDFTTYMSWDRENKSWVSSQHLRNMTVKIDFMKDKRVLFSSVNFAGYIGILTGVKKGQFSLSINERFRVLGGYVGLLEWIMGIRKQNWVGFLTRQVLEEATSYEEAMEMLEKPKLLAPVYFILSSNNSKQASVITRDRRGYDVWNFGSRYANQDGDWYLVQTNYDHWKPPPLFDDRVTPVVRCADSIGNKNTTSTLFRVLSTVPVLNHETIYTAIMKINTGDLYTWVRHCQWPC